MLARRMDLSFFKKKQTQENIVNFFSLCEIKMEEKKRGLKK